MKLCSDHLVLPTAAVAGIRRAEQVFYEQVGDKRTLEYGIAFIDVEYPLSEQDNAFREVLIERPEDVAGAWAEVEAFYTSHGLRCRRWIPCLAQSTGVIEPFLTNRGMPSHAFAAMAITKWPALEPDRKVRIVPARAVRQAFRSLHANESFARIEERRLDYAQYDVHVAMLDGRPAGRCGFLQAGEIGHICNLFVADGFRRRRIGTTLMSHALDMARRLMMKVVCCKVGADDAAGLSFLQACGFEQQGQIVEFHRT